MSVGGTRLEEEKEIRHLSPPSSEDVAVKKKEKRMIMLMSWNLKVLRWKEKKMVAEMCREREIVAVQVDKVRRKILRGLVLTTEYHCRGGTHYTKEGCIYRRVFCHCVSNNILIDRARVDSCVAHKKM